MARRSYELRVTGYRFACGVADRLQLRNVVCCGLVVAASTLLPSASANIVITMEASTSNGTPITGDVAAQSVIQVDVLLSVDEADDPLLDLKTVRFDFGGTTAALVARNFHWILPPGVDSDSYTLFETLPLPRLTYGFNSRQGNSIIDLDQTPVLVASLEVTVNSSGSLDLRNVGTEQADGGLLFRAGFTEPVDFTVAARNVSGGTLRISVTGGGGPDTDRDGVPDSADDFPFNPNETIDTDNDGIGNNADLDDDGDGVPDARDAFPLDPTETLDTDGDGIGNNADTDDDNDSVLDVNDACPLDAGETRDSDGDGICDNADPDSPDDRNEGPRATGGLCGGSVAAAMLLTSLLMLGSRSARRRASSRSLRGVGAGFDYTVSAR